MIYTDLTKKALKLAYEAHAGQRDKSGLPYIFHPFHLAEQMTDEISTVCALLHDVVEDTDYTLSDLSEMGFPESVTEVISLLTHKDGVDYMDYVAEIAKNPTARAVKIADLLHNSDRSRLNGEPDEWAMRRYEKYKAAYEYLMKVGE